MVWKLTSVICLAVCVLGEGPATSEQIVKINHSKEQHGHHGELSHIGSHKPEHHEEYAWSYPSYEFAYKVNDPHTKDIKGQQESRDGDEVKGEYWLIEPDGRKRTVRYHADKKTGFKAHVEYSAPHHHVHLKTHKHIDHKPVVEHVVEHHPEDSLPHVHHKPIIHHEVEHKPIKLEYKRVLEHKPIVHIPIPIPIHKPLVDHHHYDYKPHRSRPILRRLEENYHKDRYYRSSQ